MNLTLNQIIQRVTAVALAHKQIKTFAYVSSAVEYLHDSQRTNIYPVCLVEQNTAAFSTTGRTLTHTFRFYLLDLVNRAAETDVNEVDVISDMVSVAGDLIALFRDPAYYDTWSVPGDASATIITDYSAEYVAGCAFDLQIQVFYLADRCEVPASALPADTIELITTGQDWKVLQLRPAAGLFSVTLIALQGAKLLNVFREDSVQERVFSTPTDVRQYDFNSNAGTLVWWSENIWNGDELLTIIYK
jgi:hypothetical protein